MFICLMCIVYVFYVYLKKKMKKIFYPVATHCSIRTAPAAVAKQMYIFAILTYPSYSIFKFEPENKQKKCLQIHWNLFCY